MEDRSSIYILKEDGLTEVFKFLPKEDLNNVKGVCRIFNEVVKNNITFWQKNSHFVDFHTVHNGQTSIEDVQKGLRDNKFGELTLRRMLPVDIENLGITSQLQHLIALNFQACCLTPKNMIPLINPSSESLREILIENHYVHSMDIFPPEDQLREFKKLSKLGLMACDHCFDESIDHIIPQLDMIFTKARHLHTFKSKSAPMKFLCYNKDLKVLVLFSKYIGSQVSLLVEQNFWSPCNQEIVQFNLERFEDELCNPEDIQLYNEQNQRLIIFLRKQRSLRHLKLDNIGIAVLEEVMQLPSLETLEVTVSIELNEVLVNKSNSLKSLNIRFIQFQDMSKVEEFLSLFPQLETLEMSFECVCAVDDNDFKFTLRELVQLKDCKLNDVCTTDLKSLRIPILSKLIWFMSQDDGRYAMEVSAFIEFHTNIRAVHIIGEPRLEHIKLMEKKWIQLEHLIISLIKGPQKKFNEWYFGSDYLIEMVAILKNSFKSTEIRLNGIPEEYKEDIMLKFAEVFGLEIDNDFSTLTLNRYNISCFDC